jgi:small subunit ribosomal protein S3
VGRKVHPIGFRLGYTRLWDSRWFADKEYATLADEDARIRKFIVARFDTPQQTRPGGRRGSVGAGISHIEIERAGNRVWVRIQTARPGVVIGRQGGTREQLLKDLIQLTGKRVDLRINEIKEPELDAYLVARAVAEQIERRVTIRRAIKMAAERVIRAGAKGVKIVVSGRLGGAEMSRSEKEIRGTVPLQTLRADIDYGFTEANTTYGKIGVKVWIHKGEAQPLAPGQPETPAETGAPAVPARPRRRRVRRTARPTPAAETQSEEG